MDDFDLEVELLLEPNERDHDLRLHLDVFLRHISGGLKDRTDLHLGDFRIGNTKAAAAVAEHRIELVKVLDPLGDLVRAHSKLLSEGILRTVIVRQEFVERRIEETDRGREAFERFEDAGEVLALVRQELLEGVFALGCLLGENHLAHRVNAVALKEHVFGAGEADASRAKGDGIFGLLGIIGIRAYFKAGDLRTPVHKLIEVFILLGLLRGLVAVDQAHDDLRRSGCNLAGVDGACRAIDREEVPFFEGLSRNGDRLLIVVDVQRGGAADTDFAHLARHERGVRGDAALGGEDALGSDHAAKVFGRCLGADKENLLTFLLGGHRAVGIEVDPAGSGTWARRETGSKDLRLLDLVAIKHRSEQLIELVGRIAHHCGLPVDELLIDHVDRELERGHCGALAVTRLEHVQPAFLDRELKILHVLEMLLQGLADLLELGKRFWHLLLEKSDRLGGADARHDVFALGIDEVFAVKFFYAICRIAGECDAGSRFLTGVSEDHRLNVDGCAPCGGDAVFAAIDNCPIVHPRPEDSANGAFELVPGTCGKRLAGAFLDESLEALHEFLLIFCGQLAVRRRREGLHCLVIESEIEDRIHHARHRVAGA